MKLGVSIYPEHSTVAKDKEYLSLAASYNFKRVFACLLSVNKPIQEIKEKYTEIITHANQLGMEVVMDIAPHIFAELGIAYNNLSFFK